MKAIELPITVKRTSRKADPSDWVTCPKTNRETKATQCLICNHLCIVLEDKVKCKYNPNPTEFCHPLFNN